MTFEELKNVEHGSVLISKCGDERCFLGFIDNDKSIVTKNVKSGSITIWDECEIRDWKLKPKEREFKVLYECWDSMQNYIYYSTEERCAIKGGRKFKRYLDNGEVEVMNE